MENWCYRSSNKDDIYSAQAWFCSQRQWPYKSCNINGEDKPNTIRGGIQDLWEKLIRSENVLVFFFTINSIFNATPNHLLTSWHEWWFQLYGFWFNNATTLRKEDKNNFRADKEYDVVLFSQDEEKNIEVWS